MYQILPKMHPNIVIESLDYVTKQDEVVVSWILVTVEFVVG